MRIWCWVLLLVSLNGSIGLLNAEPVKVDKLNRKNWVVTETANFKVLSDLNSKRVLKIVRDLEKFRAFSLYLLNSPAQISGAQPIVVIATKSRKTWSHLGLPKDYVSITDTVRSGQTTIFADIKGFTGSTTRKSNMGKATVFSAIAFQLFHDLDLIESTPFWYQEGVYHYLAGFTEKDSYYSVGELEAMGRRLAALFQSNGRLRRIDVKALMSRKSYVSPVTNTEIKGLARDQFLAQAYLLVHYLYSDQERTKMLSKFLASEGVDLTLEQRIQNSFGKTSDQLALNLAFYAESKVSSMIRDKELVDKELSSLLSNGVEQRVLNEAELWRLLQPRMARLPESILSFQNKKEMYNKVKHHLPEIESLF